MFSIIRRRVLFSLFPRAFASEIFSSLPITADIAFKKAVYIKNLRFKHLPRIQPEIPPGSKYAPISPLEAVEESVQSTLKDKVLMTDAEWDDFKSDLIEAKDIVSEENFSSIVMSVILSSNQLQLGHSFLKYLENCPVKPNFLTYLKYISLCSMNHRVVDQKVILNILEKVKVHFASSPVLDLRRAEYVIQGLCATDRWRESFQYLDKLVNRPSRHICYALACAAIRNNDVKLAWEILIKWLNACEPINDRVIEEFLLVALEKQKDSCWESDVLILKLLDFMQKRDVIVSLDVAKLFEEYFSRHRFKWNITYTKVSRKAVCGSCSQSLQTFELKDYELNELREKFLQRCVMKSDMYINTNQRELTNYMKFVESNKPFHIVLDGLNAAHSFPGHHSRKNHSAHLLRIVRKMAGNYRKVLVIGRKHMRSWPGIERIRERANLFFTDNISQDDPFVVYAALASGPNTLFLSDDLMRDHLSRLEDPKLIFLFKRWQLSHQIFIQKDGQDGFNVKFIEPVRHGITPQGTMEHGWHIPFDDKIILDPYEELNNWICIQRVI